MPTSNTVLIKRGALTTPAGTSVQAAPGSGATITIFDSTLNTNGLPPIVGLPFSRVAFNLNSSHDSGASGVVFKSEFDGTANNWRTQSSQTYTAASGPYTFDYLMKGGHLQILYTNSANALTAWEYELVGILADRNPGA